MYAEKRTVRMFLVYFIELHKFIPMDSRADKFISFCYITDKLDQISTLSLFIVWKTLYTEGHTTESPMGYGDEAGSLGSSPFFLFSFFNRHIVQSNVAHPFHRSDFFSVK